MFEHDTVKLNGKCTKCYENFVFIFGRIFCVLCNVVEIFMIYISVFIKSYIQQHHVWIFRITIVLGHNLILYMGLLQKFQSSKAPKCMYHNKFLLAVKKVLYRVFAQFIAEIIIYKAHCR